MHLRLAAGLALVALGLAHSVSILAGRGPIRALGFHFLVSPVPIVFGRSGPVETYARRFRVEVTTRDGEVIDLGRGRRVAHTLQGPFTRRKVFVELFQFWDSWNAPAKTLGRAFCREDSLAREFGIEAPIRIASVETWSSMRPKRWRRAFSIACEI